MAIPEHLQRKIAEAKTGAAGTPITEGEYLLVVKRILCETKFNGTFFIPEFDVVHAEKTNPAVEPNRVKSECSCAWAVDASGKSGEAQRGNIKQFICALLNLDEKTAESEIMSKANQYAGPTGDSDSLRARGMMIECSCRRRTIKTGPNAGKEGAFPRFKNVDSENAPGEVSKRRAELDSARR